jgi:hypothetical protein
VFIRRMRLPAREEVLFVAAHLPARCTPTTGIRSCAASKRGR